MPYSNTSKVVSISPKIVSISRGRPAKVIRFEEFRRDGWGKPRQRCELTAVRLISEPLKDQDPRDAA